MTDLDLLATELRVGDFVDLEGDTYADPKRNRRALKLGYQRVDAVDRGTPNFVLVGFHQFDHVGFPASHPLKIMARRS